MLGRLLQYEINEEKVTDVHDRALLYYRLLVKGVPEVRDTVCLVVLSAIQTVFSSSGQEGPFCPKKHCRHGRAGPHPGTARFRLPRVQLPFSDLRSHRRDLYCSGASLRQGAPCRCWKHVWDFLRNLFRANNNIFSPRISPNFRNDENEMVGDVLQPTYSSAHDEGHDDGGLLASITTSSAAAPVFRLVEGPKVAAKVFQQYWGSFQTA